MMPGDRASQLACDPDPIPRLGPGPKNTSIPIDLANHTDTLMTKRSGLETVSPPTTATSCRLAKRLMPS